MPTSPTEHRRARRDDGRGSRPDGGADSRPQRDHDVGAVVGQAYPPATPRRDALPLVAEYGAAVTTAQVARAAGIGEATIFRAFTGKEELVDACVAEALSPDHVLRELASVSLSTPLPDRLTEAAEAMRAHVERIGAVIGTLYESGHRRRPSAQVSLETVHEAVAELIEPDRASLRIDPATVASLFIGMLFTQPQPTGSSSADDRELSAGELVSVLLHGTLRAPASPARRSR